MRKTLVCFGDSNTHGTVPMETIDDVRRFESDRRWTGLLAAALGAEWQVHEEGLPGRTTVHPDPIEGEHLAGLAAVPILIGTHTPIDALVLMLGTNDLKARFGVDAADIAAGLERLILALRLNCQVFGRPLPQVVLVAPPPILETGCLADMFAGGRTKSLRLAAQVERVARRTSAVFVDAGRNVQSSEVDGIHFEADQHATLAEALRREILALPLQAG